MQLTNEISNAFNRCADDYDKAALVPKEVGERLFERLQLLKINPKYILDLGCGTGVFSKKLKKKYPKAHIVGLDLAINMLGKAKDKHGFISRWSLVNANMLFLPFAAGIFDLVFVNQAIHLVNPMSMVIRELNRVMAKDGCLMFSTLGPDTGKEIRASWDEVDNLAHVNIFPDMHDIGDRLLAEKFIDPVVDMEKLTIHYESVIKMSRSLKSQGSSNINSSRCRGLMGKKSWHDFEVAAQKYFTASGKFPLTYEVVYGHAWKGMQGYSQAGTETYVPISQIKRSL